MQDPIELSTDECRRLLSAGIAGRVALSTPGGPHIIPVNYAVVDDAIIIRTSPYSVLGTHGRDTLLAFEVDQLDHEYQVGWSVVARGRGEVITDPREVEHIRTTWEPRPWAAGNRALFLRLRWVELSGRRLGSGSGSGDLTATLPVRRTV